MSLEQRVKTLEAELDRIKAAASADLQSVQNLLIAETRKVNSLKTEIAKQREDSPEAKEAKELLILWRDTLRNGHKLTDISLDSDRGAAVLRSLKNPKRGMERIKQAILGVQYDDWAMGRTSKQTRPYNDIAKHILHDSDRFEHFVGLFVQNNQPAAPAPVSPPQLSLVPSEKLSPLERVLERFPTGRAYTDGVMTVCPCCQGSLFVRSLKREHGELVLVDCYGTPACDRASVMLAAGLDAGELLETRHSPGSWVLPENVRQTMGRLLELDAAHGREAV